jgi:hypothetical protein
VIFTKNCAEWATSLGRRRIRFSEFTDLTTLLPQAKAFEISELSAGSITPNKPPVNNFVARRPKILKKTTIFVRCSNCWG